MGVKHPAVNYLVILFEQTSSKLCLWKCEVGVEGR